MEYEYARNLAILFFYERLMDRGEPRTLHDLSCQFGCKSFTKEMRQIVGSSQNGLRKFLSQYPTLFTIHGDIVDLNVNSDSNSLQAAASSTETVQYFVEKLTLYGSNGVQVPIRSLLGHRSQASGRIRHVIGPQYQDFREFLLKHPDAFTVCEQDDTVTLTVNHIDPAVQDNSNHQILFDFLAQCIEVKGPILIEQLFQLCSCNLSDNIWQDLFNTPQQLLSFLKRFPTGFQVEKNLVTVVKIPPPVERPLKQTTLKERIHALVHESVQHNREWDMHRASGTDNWKVRILQTTRIIDSLKDCPTIELEIMENTEYNWMFAQDKPVIAVDCETVNTNRITVIQLCTNKGPVYIFDVQTCPELTQYLKPVLESEMYVKIIHDCRNDSINLLQQFGIHLTCVFDTQIVHSVLNFQTAGHTVYKSKTISLNRLSELYESQCANPLRDHIKHVYRRDPDYWSRRPFTHDTILYLASNVFTLINDNVYGRMRDAIHESNRDLLTELCMEQVMARIDPDTIKMQKRIRKTRSEIDQLQCKLNQTATNIVLTNREIRLLRHVDLTEADKSKLRQSVKVAKKLEKLENTNNNINNNNGEGEDDEYESLDSSNTTTTSSSNPNNSSEPSSLTESMQMVDTILSDSKLNRLDKITRLESILATTSETLLPSSVTDLNHGDRVMIGRRHGFESVLESHDTYTTDLTHRGTQTLSTGDIVVTKIYFGDAESIC